MARIGYWVWVARIVLAAVVAWIAFTWKSGGGFGWTLGYFLITCMALLFMNRLEKVIRRRRGGGPTPL